ncbi:hypothetical protein LTR28_011754 [Elasticomyces elasticus]|nr:hypothetical protein LTR28_011754 [Elasticomyces elasticus]
MSASPRDDDPEAQNVTASKQSEAGVLSGEAPSAGTQNPKQDVDIVDWGGPNDPENPTLTVCINGTAMTVAAEQINEEFGISDATFPNSYWPVTSWSVGGALFLMVGLPLMEDFGVRRGFLVRCPGRWRDDVG